ncbi:peptidase T [Thiospirochaeta perfilievii]|uniref:Peptidase T n=1 Tax=Thiospirochaeta perfilievii TaxID=252967 RepID=A0A5C1QBC1_9SPIO|nr:peptidase T [Thiospirochaeta perfilievii]QEN03462.1 peptidase T [Thiospirochaeta perfilievii]
MRDSEVVKRFINYIKINTQSCEDSETCPSTKSQLDLAHLLEKELNELHLRDVSVDENGYVIAELPANTDKKLPVIGFIAHMDTAPDMSGLNVKPKFNHNYNGNDIVLNVDKGIILSPKNFPEMKNYIGDTLITTDGTTLLGADDKAGIAEIMTAIKYLIEHPEIEHGTIKIGFTPDEEIGQGADKFNIKKFAADYAYTVDGGEIGELEYENFNAAEGIIVVHGTNVHPGSAKNKMVNSIEIAGELNSLLPADQKPEYTDNYEGFFHLHTFNGTVEESKLKYIIRDHDMEKFAFKKDLLIGAVDFINKKYGNIVSIKIKDQYYNMREKIVPFFNIVKIAQKAMKEVGVTPIIKPVRGGTDGARLSYMGLPTPNIFTGGHNFHGKYEYIPVSSMEKSVEVIIKIVELTK